MEASSHSKNNFWGSLSRLMFEMCFKFWFTMTFWPQRSVKIWEMWFWKKTSTFTPTSTHISRVSQMHSHDSRVGKKKKNFFLFCFPFSLRSFGKPITEYSRKLLLINYYYFSVWLFLIASYSRNNAWYLVFVLYYFKHFNHNVKAD